ncbi:hypothetical protein [Halorussus amylolyticus]|uniref:hypothetical protein n=1 Tax=Halorussus amylolyticus TaxID=1126242 RepID=UPI00138F0091|nr:hypothetical protein [Halorussus amylolyticus]
MTDAPRTLFVAGAALVAGAVALPTIGVVGLLGAGVGLMLVGGLWAFEGHNEDGAGSAECPGCGTRNWADRATCRECDEQLL